MRLFRQPWFLLLILVAAFPFIVAFAQVLPPEVEQAAVWIVVAFLGYLGPRLVGLNWWSLDKTLYKLPELAQFIANLELPGRPPVSVETPPVPPKKTVEERLAALETMHAGGAHP